MTEIPNIKGRLPAGSSARDLLNEYWHAHGILQGENPTHYNEGTVTFAWHVNTETQEVEEWLVEQRVGCELPFRLQKPGDYRATDVNDGNTPGDPGTVHPDSSELDPIRHKGIGSGEDFEEGDPNPDGSGLFYSEGTGAFIRPFEQLKAEYVPRDLDGDGLDDVTGAAFGVVRDFKSRTGWSLNGVDCNKDGSVT